MNVCLKAVVIAALAGVLARQAHATTYQYVYDEFGRLTKVCVNQSQACANATPETTYTYDTSDNRLTEQ